MNTFFSTSDILARYDVTMITLRRWIADGTFPKPMKIGNRYRWKISEVEAFEESRKG
jgi:prophage regulatory protein